MTPEVTYQAALFDLDGTIADTLPHLFASFRHAVEPFVRRLPTDAEIVATFGPAEAECIGRLLKNPDLADVEAVQHQPAAAERFVDFYQGHLSEIQAFPGIVDLIQELHHRNIAVGVFTGKARPTTIFTLEHLGLLPFIRGTITSDEVKKPKPDPEGVFQALELLNTFPYRLIVVGDTPADVLAGRAAAARTVGALWGAFDPAATRDAGPTWVCHTVAELRDILLPSP